MKDCDKEDKLSHSCGFCKHFLNLKYCVGCIHFERGELSCHYEYHDEIAEAQRDWPERKKQLKAHKKKLIEEGLLPAQETE